MCYPAIIQSGGNYSLKFSAISDDDNVHFGVIICSLGVLFHSYCSNIVRTLLVKPTKEIEENYNFLLKVEKTILKKLTAGEKLSNVYEKAITFVKNEKPQMIDHLTKNFGFAMGIEFRENSMIIGPNTSTVAKKRFIHWRHCTCEQGATSYCPHTISKKD